MNNATYQLFLTELHEHLKKFFFLLGELKETTSPKDELEEIYEVLHEVKSSTMLVKFNQLNKLLDKAESTINQIIKKNHILSKHHVSFLNSIYDILDEISKKSPSDLENHVNMISDSIKMIIDAKIEEETIPNKTNTPPPPNQEPSSVNQDEPNPEIPIDPNMLDIFVQDIKKHTKKIQNNLIIYEQKKSSQTLKLLRQSSHSLKESSKALNLDFLSKLSDTMEKIFIKTQHNEFEMNSTVIDILLSAIDELEKFSQVTEQTLFSTLTKNYRNISILQRSMTDLLEERKTIPVQKKESEEATSSSTTNFEFIDPSLLEIFATDMEDHVALITKELLAYEKEPNIESLDTLMRAAHSIKGSSRVLKLDSLVQLAHKMEEIFTRAKTEKQILESNTIDILLSVNDLFEKFITLDPEKLYSTLNKQSEFISALHEKIDHILLGKMIPDQNLAPILALSQPKTRVTQSEKDTVLRVTARSLNKLMALAGETLVGSRWFHSFYDSILKLKKTFDSGDSNLINLEKTIENLGYKEKISSNLREVKEVNRCFREELSRYIIDFEFYLHRYHGLFDNLYQEVLENRMRPFSDISNGMFRFVRDTSRQLGKKAVLNVIGANTPVDREILAKLESPLNHLLHNAIKHGIEPPVEREKFNKSEIGLITIEAEHIAGMFSMRVSDDGRGISLDTIRKKILEKHLTSPDMISKLSDNELYDFLFLPGFSTMEEVTEHAGRGVGLDIVNSMIQEIKGSIQIDSKLYHGVTFHLQLPLTLSVVSVLLLEISGEPYALPLGRIDQVLKIDLQKIKKVEGREYFIHEGETIGIVPAYQILELEPPTFTSTHYNIVMISKNKTVYGLIVDRFLGENELVVQEFDQRIGKVSDISSGSLTEDANPILILDIGMLFSSIETFLSTGRIKSIKKEKNQTKQILIVEDSPAVREVEERLLKSQGYTVTSAKDGIEGWNDLRTGNFDLVITDIDMPHMGGIELIKLIRNEAIYQNLPIIVVSYKDSERDKHLGLEAGATHYLTKGSFYDKSLISIVEKLIGPSQSEEKQS